MDNELEMFDEFGEDMARKFVKKAKKYGNSWKHVLLYRLRRSLKEHVDKWLDNHNSKKKSSREQEEQDLIDIANFCCMLCKRINDECKEK